VAVCLSDLLQASKAVLDAVVFLHLDANLERDAQGVGKGDEEHPRRQCVEAEYSDAWLGTGL